MGRTGANALVEMVAEMSEFVALAAVRQTIALIERVLVEMRKLEKMLSGSYE